MAGYGALSYGRARHGRNGKAGLVMDGLGQLWLGMAGTARRGVFGYGRVRRDKAWQAWQVEERLGGLRKGAAR